jgi:hypothetical protein
VPHDTGEALNLAAFPASRATVLGIGGRPEQRILFGAVFEINHFEIRSLVDIRDDVDIVLLGRDVLQRTALRLSWKEKSVAVNDP